MNQQIPARPLDATYHESIPANMSDYWRSLVADYAAHLHAAYARERALRAGWTADLWEQGIKGDEAERIINEAISVRCE